MSAPQVQRHGRGEHWTVLAGQGLEDAREMVLAAMLDASLSLEETGAFQVRDLETLVDGARVLRRLVDAKASVALGYLCSDGDRGVLSDEEVDRLSRLLARHREVFEQASFTAERVEYPLHLLEVERADRLSRLLAPASEVRR